MANARHEKERRCKLCCDIIYDLCLVAALVSFGLLIGYAAFAGDNGPCTLSARNSPANEALRLETVKFDGDIGTTNAYKGPLGKDLDDAWTQLYEVNPFLVTTEELEKIGKTSAIVPSRPGSHLVKLAVFHQLHCLDMIRKNVHDDYYQMDDSRASVSLVDHVDHCIDMLRQSIMCTSDTTMITFSGDPLLETAEPDFNTEKVCVDFGNIHQWAKSHEFNMLDEVVRHPAAYADLLAHGAGMKRREMRESGSSSATR
ncbi:hypothetical protein AJ80_02860 [Polytolypa hystricis UAMH7299]|uniref:Tat pathway signal sequence n=1 Tax=Polytolypa hystricis (strain UAMH7299) TaxID=1447883 RepID=A0A2B7YN81_POLH7|nr:hypothetical protein AJ80_02860 [Polytolypa hystricis UAMH7299]